MKYLLVAILFASCGYDKACDYTLPQSVRLYYSEEEKAYCLCADPPGKDQHCIYKYYDDFMNKKVDLGSISDHKPLLFSDSCEAKGAMKKWLGPDTPTVKLKPIQ